MSFETAAHDLSTTTATLAALASNDNLLRNCERGAEPGNPVAGMLWEDDTGSPVVLKIRNAANDGWIVLCPDLDKTWGGLQHMRQGVVSVRLGTLSAASATLQLLGGPSKIEVQEVLLTTPDTTSSDVSNKWVFQVERFGTGGTVDLMSSDYDSNVSGDFAASTPLALGVDQNKDVDIGQGLRLVATKTGSPGDPTDVIATIRYRALDS